MEKFYTKHVFAKALHKITNGIAFIAGTVHLNVVDLTNKVLLECGNALLSNKKRGK